MATAAPPTPAAPASSAPSSAPSSTPSTPSTPSSTPLAPSTPAVSTPVPASTPEAPTAPATEAPAPPAGKSEPKQSDYPGDIETFLNKHNEWEREGGVHEELPDDKSTDPDVAAAAARDEKPAKEQPEPKVEKPAEVTPEVVNNWIQSKPGFKALLDQDPGLKNDIFAMARVNAKAQPMLEIYPNVESAKFADETSNKWVGLQSGFRGAADNPETFPAVFQQFASEFMVVDDKGQPILDPDGKPTYGQDYHLMTAHVANERDQVEMTRLQAAVAANPDDETADMALKAFEFLKDWREASQSGTIDKPNLDGLTPEQRAWQEKKEREFAERETKLDGQNKQQTREQKVAARESFEKSLVPKVGGMVGKRLKDLVAQAESDGVYIPSYVTDVRDPESGISAFAKTLMDKWTMATVGIKQKDGSVRGGVAHIRNHMAQLQRLPPGPDAERQRMEYVAQLIDQHLPGIFDRERRSITQRDIEDREKRSKQTGAVRATTANVEPAGGNTVGAPASMDDKSVFSRAAAAIDKNFPDLTGAERMTRILQERNRLQAR